MSKIDARTIKIAYDVARQAASGQLAETTAIASLVSEHGMNPTSATIYIRNLAMMLEGKTLKRTMSAPTFAIYLDRIADDYDAATAKKAIDSVRSHVAYYNALGRGTLNQVASICDTAEARLR